MSNRRHDSPDPAEVYRRVSTERSPDSLDEAVLSAATGATAARRAPRFLAPVALAATVVLAVIVAVRSPSPGDNAPLAPVSDQSAPARTASPPLAADEVAQEFERPALESRARRQVESVREKALQLPNARQAKPGTAPPDANPARYDNRDDSIAAASRSVERADDRACRNERQVAEHWLACVEGLEKAADPRADAERAAFDAAHPEFAGPEPD